MKRFSLIAASFVFAAVFAVSAFGQTPAPNYRIVVVDPGAFIGKDGIVKYTAANTTLENEFKPVQTELNGLVTKGQNLEKEIQALQANASKVPIDQKAAQAKVDEMEKIKRDIKFKQEDAQSRFARRRQEIVGPVEQEIGRALNEFAKQKGYALILNLASQASAEMILALDETKVDVTKEFITFFNARPAGTASTAAPK